MAAGPVRESRHPGPTTEHRESAPRSPASPGLFPNSCGCLSLNRVCQSRLAAVVSSRLGDSLYSALRAGSSREPAGRFTLERSKVQRASMIRKGASVGTSAARSAGGPVERWRVSRIRARIPHQVRRSALQVPAVQASRLRAPKSHDTLRWRARQKCGAGPRVRPDGEFRL